MDGSKLFSTSDNSYATTNLSSREIQIDPQKGQEGSAQPRCSLPSSGTEPHRGRWVVELGCEQLSSFNGNRDLFLNMVNWLSSDEELISIRPKDPEDRRLALSRAR